VIISIFPELRNEISQKHEIRNLYVHVNKKYSGTLCSGNVFLRIWSFGKMMFGKLQFRYIFSGNVVIRENDVRDNVFGEML